MGKASRIKRERRDNPPTEETTTVTEPPELDDVPEHLMPDVTMAIGRKESAVKKKEEDTTDDLVPNVVFFRDDKVVAHVICRDIDRDQALDACWVGVPGFDADEVRVTMDAHYSTELGPRPGERWQPGQMQKMCDEEGACQLGLITDCLWIMRVTRDGELEFVNLPYHVHKSAKTVRWIDREHAKGQLVGYAKQDEHSGLAGLVPDTIREAFKRQTLTDATGQALQIPDDKRPMIEAELKRLGTGITVEQIEGGLHFEDFGLTPQAARVHADCAMTRLMMSSGKYAIMLAAYDDESAEIIQRSTERMQQEMAGVETHPIDVNP